jgi:hypothetical protein
VAFCQTFHLIERWKDENKHPIKELGLGVLTAAVGCLRKAISEKEIAAILYEYADDLGTREQ